MIGWPESDPDNPSEPDWFYQALKVLSGSDFNQILMTHQKLINCIRLMGLSGFDAYQSLTFLSEPDNFITLMGLSGSDAYQSLTFLSEPDIFFSIWIRLWRNLQDLNENLIQSVRSESDPDMIFSTGILPSSVRWSVRPSIHPPVHSSDYPSVCRSVCLSARPSVHPYIHSLFLLGTRESRLKPGTTVSMLGKRETVCLHTLRSVYLWP